VEAEAKMTAHSSCCLTGSADITSCFRHNGESSRSPVVWPN
jgi:hypothetical protein